MADFSLKHDIDKIIPDFNRLMTASNFKFAVAKTLTGLAKEAQTDVKAKMPKSAGGPFHIRRQWVVGGVRIQTANKTNLQSAVYSLDSGGRRGFMTNQEFGGIKTPEKSQHIAIPLKSIRGDPTKQIPQMYKPKALLGGAIEPRVGKNGRVRLVSTMGLKAIKVDGRKPGTQFILIKRAGKYVAAWLLAPMAKIKETDFLIKPSMTLIKRRASTLLIANVRDAMRGGNVKRGSG